MRLRCDGGQTGLGYTYTVSRGGAALHDQYLKAGWSIGTGVVEGAQ